MEIDIELDKKDWYVYLKYCNQKLLKNASTWNNGFLFLFYLSFLYSWLSLKILEKVDYFHQSTAIALSIVFMLIFLSYYIIRTHKLNKAFEPSLEGVLLGKQKFILSEQGIENIGNKYKANFEWSAVKSVDRSNGLIMVFLDTSYAFILSENKLSDPDAVYNLISKYHHKLGS